MTTNAPVTESELEEISTRLPILNTFTGGDVIPLDKNERDALCASLRAAWAKFDAEDKDHRLTIDTFRQQERIWQQRFDEQEKANAALREQLAENARRHFDDARSLERQRNEALDQCAELHRRLAQQRRTITYWQNHIKRMGRLLNCPAIDGDVENAVKDLQSRLAQVEKELTKAKRHRDDLIEELREQP